MVTIWKQYEQRDPSWHAASFTPGASPFPFLMSPVPARLIFPFFLAVNCLLWSRSRYAQPSPLNEQSSLVRRISYQLTNPQTIHPFTTKKEARNCKFTKFAPFVSNKKTFASVGPLNFQRSHNADTQQKIVHKAIRSLASITSAITFAQTSTSDLWLSQGFWFGSFFSFLH